MIRYWLKFDSTNADKLPPGLQIGCGVTALNFNDALSIVKENIFKGQEIPELRDQKENIDISTLDQRHVVPNMKDPTLRGIWFPLGYE